MVYADGRLDYGATRGDGTVGCLLYTSIGFFDGLHLGHMALVNEVIHQAQKKGYKKALMTFDHYPLYVLGKIDEERYLTSMDDRKCLLEQRCV